MNAALFWNEVNPMDQIDDPRELMRLLRKKSPGVSRRRLKRVKQASLATYAGAVWTFTIPGDPVGYYAQGARNKWRMSPDQRARAERYRAYQEHARTAALAAGVPVPLHSTNVFRFTIETRAYFASGVHCDPGNVQKGVVDALFHGQSDKHTGGSFPPPMYDAARPRVEVRIEQVKEIVG